MTATVSGDAWDRLAATRADAETNTWRGDPAEHDEMLRWVERAVVPGRVLDLGCGTGRLASPIAAAHPDTTVIGFDASAGMLRWAEDPAVEWVHGDCSSLGALGPLDGAWSVLVFQHLDEATKRCYLDVLGGLLLPGARLVLQWVVEGETGPLSHPASVADMLRWVVEAGLGLRQVSVGAIYPQWAWLVAEAR